MLDLNQSRVVSSQMMALSGTVASIEEGTLLSVLMEGGIATVAPSTGVAGEMIAGIARSQVMNPTTSPKSEIITVPSVGPFAVTLAKVPNSTFAQIGAFDTTTGVAVVGAAAAAAGFFSFVPGTRVITFDAAQAGQTLRVHYEYNLTLAEAMLIYGQGIGDAAQSVVNGTDCITHAQFVFTNKFDPTDNWAAGGPIYSGANGKLTLKTAGTLIPRAYVYAAPNSQNGDFLGLYFHV